MKKVFLMMVMLFTMSVYSFAEDNNAAEIERIERYDIKVNAFIENVQVDGMKSNYPPFNLVTIDGAGTTIKVMPAIPALRRKFKLHREKDYRFGAKLIKEISGMMLNIYE